MTYTAAELEAKGQEVLDALGKWAGVKAKENADNLYKNGGLPSDQYQSYIDNKVSVFKSSAGAQGIPARFRWFAGPDPDSFSSVWADIEQVRTTVTDNTLGTCHTVANELEDWEGAAGETFRLKFLPTIPASVANQVKLLEQMKNHLHVARLRTTRVREDVMKFGDAAVKAISHQAAPMSLELALTCVVAVGSIGVAIGLTAVTAGLASPTLAEAGVLAFTILGGVIGDGGDAVRSLAENDKKMKLDGHTAEELAASVNRELDKLAKAVYAIDEEHANDLQKDFNVVEKGLNSHFLPKSISKV